MFCSNLHFSSTENVLKIFCSLLCMYEAWSLKRKILSVLSEISETDKGLTEDCREESAHVSGGRQFSAVNVHQSH